MVLQQQARSVPKAQSRLDPNRILGISSTLALNVLALSFLLAPMTIPAPVNVERPQTGLEVVPIVPVKRETVVPPEVKVVKRQTTPQPAPRTVPIERPAVDIPILVDAGIPPTEDFTETPPANDAPPGIEPAGPVTGMQLEYVKATPPPYPRVAIADSLEGVVLLRVLVGADGKPVEVTIEKSSGHRVLDREAQRHVLRTWTFRPATRDGQPVQAIGIVPIDFNLSRG